MLAKMIIDEPLPMPLSVISSEPHDHGGAGGHGEDRDQ
jgi:hypothetical protein